MVTLDNGRKVPRVVYLGAFTEAKTVLVAQEDIKNGTLAWTFYPVDKFRDSLREGDLLYWRDKAGKGHLYKRRR